MPVFDIEQQRMCVRVVYDGAASAGKTTNARQLAELFATQRTSEVFSPAEMNGRTLYFDWLQIAAGMACGFPLVCQVITVPGQQVLTPRRRHLVSSADVVVHVCDSEELALGRAADGLALFDEVEQLRGERVPLVIQANKQDQPGALSGQALLVSLGRPGVPVIEAIASDGVGVVDTFVAAVRAAVRAIQARVDRGQSRVVVQQVETATALLGKLQSEELDPEWALEMLLEEASSEFAVEAAVEEEPPQERAEALDWTERPEAISEETLVARVPTLPTENVPTGFIWPAHTGRAALRAMANEPKSTQPLLIDGNGVVRLAVGEFVLTTGLDWHFDTVEAARQALVRAARERTKLGPLLAPETVLVAQPTGDESSWLWLVLPRIPTVVELLASPDRADLPRAGTLSVYGTALADALKVEAVHGTPFDLSPKNFGIRQGAARYLADFAPNEGGPRGAGQMVVAAFVELAEACPMITDFEPAVAALESGLLTRLTPDERGKLAWSMKGEALDIAALPANLRASAGRLEEAFHRGWKAA
jgi:hypothetical protein